MGYIYKITNKLNNKVYIGQTRSARPTDRYAKHKYIASHLEKEKYVSLIHRAMNKYGLDNFTFEIIEEVENNLLNKKEMEYIQIYNSLVPNGYNLTKGGEGTLGFSRSQSEEEKNRRRESNKNFYILHPEKKEELRERTKKLWEDEEYRHKVTESNIKFHQKHPDLFKGKNNSFYGKHHSQETVDKLRKINSKFDVYQLNKDSLEVIKIYPSIKAAERELNVSHGWISKAAKENKIAYGYRWEIVQKSVTTN